MSITNISPAEQMLMRFVREVRDETDRLMTNPPSAEHLHDTLDSLHRRALDVLHQCGESRTRIEELNR